MKVYSYNREDGPGGKIMLLVTTEFHGVETLGDDDRELLRRQVADMVAQYTDDHFYNVFEDEVKEMLDLLNSGTIIGQPPVGIGEYRHGFYIWYHPTVEHENGQYLRQDFSIGNTCTFEGDVFKDKVEAMLTLYHYHTALVEEEAEDDLAMDLPDFIAP